MRALKLLILSLSLLLLGCEDREFIVHSSHVQQEESETSNEAAAQTDTTTSNSDDTVVETTEEEDSTEETTEEDANETEEEEPVALNKKSIREDLLAKEWYVRIVVEDVTNHLYSDNAQLGQLEENNVEVTHSLLAISPFGSRYLDVVFQNPEGLEEGDYKSNFHASSTHKDSWKFTIKSFDDSAHMIVSWRGLYVLSHYTDDENRTRYKEYRSMRNALLNEMVLVDLSSGEEITVLSHGKVNAIEVDMDGENERTLEWQLKAHEDVVRAKRVTYAKRVERVEDDSSVQKQKHLKELRKNAKAMHTKKEKINSTSLDVPPTFNVLVK